MTGGWPWRHPRGEGRERDLHWTTHVLTGASVGYLIGRPVPAALAGFAGHVALDTFPHHDPDADIPYVVDSAIGLGLIVAIAASGRVKAADPGGAALWGAIGAGAPDLELLAKLVTIVEPEDYLYPTHSGLIPHRQTSMGISLLTQGVLIAVTVGLAIRKWASLRQA
jgi:hypothetical protein